MAAPEKLDIKIVGSFNLKMLKIFQIFSVYFLYLYIYWKKRKKVYIKTLIEKHKQGSRDLTIYTQNKCKNTYCSTVNV